jgi:Ser/Thr protein kinase RdoA (MazF antagonist)
MSNEPLHSSAHGFGKHDVEADWPVMQQQELIALLAQYPELGALKQRRWRSPRPCSCAELVDVEAGTVFIKRYHQRIRTTQGLLQEHGFIRHLAQQDIPVPFLYVSETGETALAQGEWTYEIQSVTTAQDWYRDVRSWAPFLSSDDAEQAGAMQARLHLAAQGYDAPARTAQPLLANFRIFGAADPVQASKDWLREHPGVRAYLHGRDWEQELSENLLPWHQATHAELSRQPRLWTHNDLHSSNLLWRRTPQGQPRVATVIDFGLSDQTFALFDLATAIERNFIPWLDLHEGQSINADYPGLSQYLLGYQRQRPLPPEELNLLASLLPLVHGDFALSELAYFIEILDAPALADSCWDGYLLRHVNWFNSNSGQQLRQFIANWTPPEREARHGE